ncbi:type IV pilus secretin PilQ [Niveibacterium sp. 24ML]|uniref:type IV pilus secretin PilQ n=1 Tax=Niveibacterium sp. 24ML TaxID=2985512 RepID=UPI0022719B87|nr:type IV pilus secretin PilQ [Niveibacterium sp. 24ML]MCX9157524.1 type IV pilus secretin PilQ [Niveibacterium sp. 24ML]
MKNVVRLAAAVFLGAMALVPYGASAQATAEPANSIESFGVAKQGDGVVVRVTMKKPLGSVPASFSVANPARIAIDFPSTVNGTGKTGQVINEGDLRSANIVQAGDRTRLVLNLNRSLAYDARVEDRNLFIVLAGAKQSGTAVETTRFAEPDKKAAKTHAIRDINFRRGKDGEARVVVDLSDPGVGIDIRNQGANLVIEFAKATLPDGLRKRLDVTDFATPVTSIVTSPVGQNVRMVISPKGNWEHNAYQSESQFVVEVKQVQEDPRKLVQGAKQKYAGEKLSLNFQAIDVRSVLQVIADFTNFNIITSDSVSGNLTLRLKDVPWDQALDIILQAKGLDMRKNGNVIWIAPREELATRERMEFEAQQTITTLEPVRTESFQINYHKATAVAAFLRTTDQTVLSKRGSVVVDDRTNKLFVSDIGSRLEDVRRIITEIDVPVRQVLIEAQIVEASDAFTRNLGVRMGYGGSAGGVVGQTADGRSVGRNNFGGSIGQTAYTSGLTDTKVDLLSALGVNLPAASIGATAPGQFSFVLWNSNATRFLALEISALEADGRGKVISRPRVMTADQVEALIEQGVELPYLSSTSSGATSVSFKKANLSLKVKPQITPDGKVLMSLDVNKDTPNAQYSTLTGIAIDTKHVKTEVLVENGGTVVIGGIYTQELRNKSNKIPFLGDLPVAGYLFRDSSKTDDKTELLVFITPKIVSEQATAR